MELYIILSITIGVLSVLFSIFLLSVKTENRIANIFLALYLLTIALDISAYYYSPYICLPYSLEMLRIHLGDIKSPLMFLFILAFINKKFKLKTIHWLNALPLVISLLILAPRFFLAGNAAQKSFFDNYFSQPEVLVLNVIGYSVSFIYLIAMVIVINKNRTLIRENYASSDAYSSYRFLIYFISLVIIGFLLTFAKELFLFRGNKDHINVIRNIMLSFGILFKSWLVIKALLHPNLFRGFDAHTPLVKELLQKNKELKEEQTPLAVTIDQQIKELKDFMKREEPYTDASLTLSKLAQMMNMSGRELSILINHHLNQHFFDFINEYRIRKAMEILSNPANRKRTILEVIYEVGFNSKSPFNSAFKKFTNLTPSAFRKIASESVV